MKNQFSGALLESLEESGHLVILCFWIISYAVCLLWGLFIHSHMHAYSHVSMTLLCTHTYMHACTIVYMHNHINTHITYMVMYIRYVHSYIIIIYAHIMCTKCTCTITCVHTYMHTHAHTHTHTSTYIHTLAT